MFTVHDIHQAYRPFQEWGGLLFKELSLAIGPSTDGALRRRALQCAAPPVLTILLVLFALGFTVSQPRLVFRPVKAIYKAIPWLIPAISIAIFAAVAGPALWSHECDYSPIRLSPRDRTQWAEVWTDLNPPLPNEASWTYRQRMDQELDVWGERELDTDDLEEWVNLSAQANMKRNCIRQKEEIFQSSLATAKEEVTQRVGDWWSASLVKDIWIAVSLQAPVCSTERASRWASMMAAARKVGIRT